MDYRKPVLLVISGPNGAGKSTHVSTMLPDTFSGIQCFDRDYTRLLFQEKLKISGKVPEAELMVLATRMMEATLQQAMDEAIAAKSNFVLETPLSHPDYWLYIDRFVTNGYQIQLNYLCLDKISDCITRVAQRVMEGGHYVDPRTIRNVYETNLQHVNDYHDIFHIIELYDGMVRPVLLVKMQGGKIVFAKETALKKKWIKSGLPSIAKKITLFLGANKKMI